MSYDQLLSLYNLPKKSFDLIKTTDTSLPPLSQKDKFVPKETDSESQHYYFQSDTSNNCLNCNQSGPYDLEESTSPENKSCDKCRHLLENHEHLDRVSYYCKYHEESIDIPLQPCSAYDDQSLSEIDDYS